LLVGVDLGTQSLKAVVCDENLAVLGSHAVPLATTHPEGLGAEQDPRAWDAALAPAIGAALTAAGANAHDVAALGFAGQLDGCVAVDADDDHAGMLPMIP
jgi:xylulokinase